VLFNYNKATLTKSDIVELKKTIDPLKKYPDSRIIQQGHSDNIGPGKYNLELSYNRTETARRHLIEAGAVVKQGFRHRGSARRSLSHLTRKKKARMILRGWPSYRSVDIIIMCD